MPGAGPPAQVLRALDGPPRRPPGRAVLRDRCRLGVEDPERADADPDPQLDVGEQVEPDVETDAQGVGEGGDHALELVTQLDVQRLGHPLGAVGPLEGVAQPRLQRRPVGVVARGHDVADEDHTLRGLPSRPWSAYWHQAYTDIIRK